MSGIEPAEGQWYRNAPGDAVRVDCVRNGWVYFSAWNRHSDTGKLMRMGAERFLEALEASAMRLEDECASS